MSQTETTTATTTDPATDPAAVPGVPVRSKLQDFLTRGELCIQAMPNLSTPIGRNTLGLWLMAGPLLVMLLIKSLFDIPQGFVGWLRVLLLAIGFAFMGGGMMEWGLSGAEKMNEQAWVFFGLGVAIVGGMVLLQVGLWFGAMGGGSKGGGGRPQYVVAGGD